jgi:hypothetical protein
MKNHIFNRVVLRLQQHNSRFLKEDLGKIIGRSKSYLNGNFDLGNGPFFDNQADYSPELIKIEDYINKQILTLGGLPFTEGVIKDLFDLLEDIDKVKRVQQAKKLLKGTDHSIMANKSTNTASIIPVVRQRVDRKKQFISEFGFTAERILEVEGKTSVGSLYKKFDRVENKKSILKFPVEQYQ